MTEERLDDIDIKILRQLQRDAHLTVKELAARVHLSPSPTFERQKRLEREGYIERYMAIVDRKKVGNGIIVLCNIRLKQHSQAFIQEFMDAVQTIEEITECYNTSGDFDFLVKVYAHDMKAYQQFMLNTLGRMECIGSLHSVFVIGEIKNTRAGGHEVSGRRAAASARSKKRESIMGSRFSCFAKVVPLDWFGMSPAASVGLDKIETGQV